MPTYRVTDPSTGQTVRLTSEDATPPSEQELEQVFASLKTSTSQPRPTVPGIARSVATNRLQSLFQPRDPTDLFGIRRKITDTVAKTPQPVLDVALPIAGGVAGTAIGGPGVGTGVGTGAGAAIAKALKLARDSTGASATPQTALSAAGEIGKSAAVEGVLGGLFAGGARQVGRAFGASKLGTIISSPKRARFVQGVRQQFLQSKKLAGEDFEAGLTRLIDASPDTRIDLTEVLTGVQEKALRNPAFQSLLQRSVRNSRESALLQSFLNQPEVAADLTVKQAQALKQIFQRPLKRIFEKPGADVLESQLDLMESWHQIRAAQLKTFPELKEVFQKYSTTLNNFRAVREQLGPNSLETALSSNFQGKAELIEAAKDLLPDEMLKQIQQFQRAKQTMRGLKTLGIRVGQGAAAASGFEAVRRAF